MPMRIYIRAMTARSRTNIYNELDEWQKSEIKNLVFRPESEYPKTKGRPPKYDFLYVWVSDIGEDAADKIKEHLSDKTGRSVFYYAKTWKRKDGTEEHGFAFLLSWRSPKDGKALPNKLKFFEEIKKTVKEAVGETGISIYGKVPEKEKVAVQERKEEVKKEDLISDELIREEVPVVEERVKKEEEMNKDRAEVMEAIAILKRQKEKLEKDIASLDRIGRYMPTYRSKRKRLKKELSEVNAKIQMLRAELGEL